MTEPETNTGGAVALTFDDGPDARWTPRVLDALRAADAVATFFVTPGLGIEAVAEIAAAGHEVGYHCGRHVRHTDRERGDVADEARADLEQLGEVGATVRCWRPPWGVLAPWTRDLAASLGLAVVLWDADTEDWSGRSATTMLAGIDPSIRAGAVVLMHDGIGPGALRTEASATVELIAPLVALARGRGLEPATVSALTARRERAAA